MDEPSKTFVQGLPDNDGRRTVGVISLRILEAILLVTIAQFMIVMFASAQNTNKANLLNSEISQLESTLQLSDYKDTQVKLDAISDRLIVFNKFSQKTTDYSDFWDALQKAVVKDVSFESLAYSEKGEVAISGKAKSYEAIAKFLSSLKKQKTFSEVKLTSASNQKDYKIFSITFADKISNTPILTTTSTTASSETQGGTNE
ncbi:MAG: Uncharacterized protein CEN91_135 [Candidatus Berkelbacteria bacterium Licking1014_85]|uniref:Type IV pilus assembly protein PilN n=1 Tax=Candidatus Berkelbacteria bacterium Licking1014_85 TaxID=2017148 RepID=A0A554LLJ1_9BACT|nr:MAG: Uncharacterized protein CEN91_135 [Candidatus Berkelbacteria bacterium Licking1014_85]